MIFYVYIRYSSTFPLEATMKKEKLIRLICLLFMIVFVIAGISRCAGGNSMTLEEYAALKESQ